MNIVYLVILSSANFVQVNQGDYCAQYADAKPLAVFRIEASSPWFGGLDYIPAPYCITDGVYGNCDARKAPQPHVAISIRKVVPSCKLIPEKKSERVVVDVQPERWELKEDAQ